ncbi:uncharacterized protein LOC124687128 [Lolium rigidum]|uniref:uncharacterized protein LOC124687128 n=1 Tax=Lolium rigidum TaxID=89674 RepID=UPI001F5DE6A5|nr:uncharacterized protein LOC124687128 [Lolium rigidum]
MSFVQLVTTSSVCVLLLETTKANVYSTTIARRKWCWCPTEGISGKSRLPMLKNSSLEDDLNVVQWRGSVEEEPDNLKINRDGFFHEESCSLCSLCSFQTSYKDGLMA